MKFPEISNNKSGAQGGSGGLFVKVDDGEKINGVFRGDPHVFRTHWIDNKSFICAGKDSCSYCQDGDKPRFRFKINLVMKSDGVYMAKIFEGGFPVFKALKDMHEGGFDLEQTAVQIKREGVKKDTKYNILPLPKNGGLSDAEFKKIHAVPLNLLSEKEEVPADAADDSDLPF